MNTRLGLAAAIVLLFGSCGRAADASDGTIRPRGLHAVLGECRNEKDSVQVRELWALFEIVDHGFWKKNLYLAFDRKTFLARIERYQQKAGSAQWEEITGRLALCRRVCQTPIWHPERDLRWDLFLRYGPPSVQWVEKGHCTVPGWPAPGFLCDIFAFVWDNWGIEVACRSDSAGSFPREILHKRLATSAECGRLIEPILDFAMFPNPDRGTFDLWVAILTTADQFTPETMTRGELFLKLSILDSADLLVGRDTLWANLNLLRALWGVTEHSGVAVAAYLGCRDIPAGRYRARVSLTGAGVNGGSCTSDLVAPSPDATPGMSDLVFVSPEMACGDNFISGIRRENRQLYGNPRLVFRRGDTLHPYAEFLLPEGVDFEYTVSAVLIPIPVAARMGKGTVLVSPILSIADTEGRPWGRLAPQQEIDSEKTKRHRKPCSRVIFEETFRRSAAFVEVFDAPVVLSGVKSGRYWFILKAGGGEGKRGSRSAWAAIEVR